MTLRIVIIALAVLLVASSVRYALVERRDTLMRVVELLGGSATVLLIVSLFLLPAPGPAVPPALAAGVTLLALATLLAMVHLVLVLRNRERNRSGS